MIKIHYHKVYYKNYSITKDYHYHILSFSNIRHCVTVCALLLCNGLLHSKLVYTSITTNSWVMH